MADPVRRVLGCHVVQRRRLSVADVKVIHRIVQRAIDVRIAAEASRERLAQAIMDVHTTSMPLDLAVLAACPRADFEHDVCGIIRNFNDVERRLSDRFTPRSALPEAEVRNMILETA